MKNKKIFQISISAISIIAIAAIIVFSIVKYTYWTTRYQCYLDGYSIGYTNAINGIEKESFDIDAHNPYPRTYSGRWKGYRIGFPEGYAKGYSDGQAKT